MDQQPVAPVNSNPAMPAPAAAPQVSGVPDKWPGAFGLYKYSKVAVKHNIGAIGGLYALNIAVSAVSNYSNIWVQIVAQLVAFVLSMALYYAYLAGVRSEKLSVVDSFKKIKPVTFVKFILALLVSGILVGVSLLLLIVPFFFVLPRLLIVSYFVIDKGMGPIEAVRASWSASKGHAGKAWGIIGAQAAMILLFVTIIGIPFAIYFYIMYSAATALLYSFVTGDQAVATGPVAGPVAPTQAVGPQPPTVV